MSYQLINGIALGSSHSGLKLSATLLDTNNNIVSGQSGIALTFYEQGQGYYSWMYNNFPTNYRGSVIIHPSGTNYTTGILTQLALNPSDDEYIDTYVSQAGSAPQGANSVTIVAKDQNNAIMGGTKIEVYPSGSSSATDISVTNMSTGSSLFKLDNGVYSLFLYRPGVAHWNNPFYLTVAGDSTQNLLGTSFSVPVSPANSGLVRYYCYIEDLGLNPKAGIQMLIYPSGLSASDHTSIVFTENAISAISDNHGYVFKDTATNQPIQIQVPKAGYSKYTISPLSGIINIATL